MHDAAIGNRDDAIGHFGNDGVMGDDSSRGAEFCVDRGNGIEHQNASMDIESAGRFIAKKHGGIFGDGTSDGHTLLLATGKLSRKVVLPGREFHQCQGIARVHGVGGDICDERHVLARGEAGNEVVELEHETDMIASIAGEAGVVEFRKLLTAVEHGAAGGYVESAKDVEERAFAAARGAEQNDEFAGVEIEIDAAKRLNFDLAHMVDFGEFARRKDDLGTWGRGGKIGGRFGQGAHKRTVTAAFSIIAPRMLAWESKILSS